jgi:homoserine O-acetyltransferase/O-succinyltransferase
MMTATRELRWHRIPRLELESGEILTGVEQAYHLDGRLNEEGDNLVVIFHALTGSADAAGAWWSDMIGPGRAIDTDRYAILCTNLLGSCYGTTFAENRDEVPAPSITPRDMARLIELLVRDLGVREVALATGGSLGGMVALEWVASYPALTRAAVVFAAPAAHPAAAVGWSHIQRLAIAQGGQQGLALARMIAMMTYRTPVEFEERFGREREGEKYLIESYLDHHGESLVARFDVRSYLTLMAAMDAHDVGRGRGGVGPALRRFQGKLIGVGIPGDLLYTDGDVRSWVEAVGAEYREIHSIRGHDAFLLEPDQVDRIFREALGTSGEILPAAARDVG